MIIIGDSTKLKLGSEQLQVIPERLEARISEKKFLAAVDILQDALRITKQPEMETITALTALRLYVCNQETVSIPL